MFTVFGRTGASTIPENVGQHREVTVSEDIFYTSRRLDFVFSDVQKLTKTLLTNSLTRPTFLKLDH